MGDASAVPVPSGRERGQALFGGSETEFSPIGKEIFPSRRAKCGSDAPGLNRQIPVPLISKGLACWLAHPVREPLQTEAAICQWLRSMREAARRRPGKRPSTLRGRDQLADVTAFIVQCRRPSTGRMARMITAQIGP